jgi:general secretion pathway protein G
MNGNFTHTCVNRRHIGLYTTSVSNAEKSAKVHKYQLFNRQNKMEGKKIQAGFTLIELLIVIVILGLLMSLVAPAMFSKVDSTKIKTAMAQMQMIQTALDTYRLDMGDYPANLSDLISSDKSGWDGPYLPKKVPLDPWSNSYSYQSPGPDAEAFLLLSLGKDGQPGGENDAADVMHE